MMNKSLKRISRLFLFAFCCILPSVAFCQDGIVKGLVKDSVGNPIELATVTVLENNFGTTSDHKGKFELRLTPYKDFTLVVSFVGFFSEKYIVRLNPGETKSLNVLLKSTVRDLGTVKVVGEKSRDLLATRIEPRTIEMLPSVSGNFESALKTFPGVVSNNELSSTYSVRGGSFDENLVYVNDIEIYRPFLTRSGQQEGLSFVNSDMVAGINFSAGGFSAMYGDKLSSVLDIEYRKPDKFGGNVYGSFMGGGLTLEGISKNDKFSWIASVRQRSNQFLFKNLDTRGEYKPSFTDIQSLLNYKISKKSDLSFLGNYSQNKYQMIPSTRETEFGNINEALKFTVFFDGQEIDAYKTSQGAFSFNTRPNDHLNLKFITAAFITKEQEFFDILGQYFLDELERDLGSSNFGEVAFNKGVGAFLNHARNELEAQVTSAEHKGSLNYSKLGIKWGFKYQHEKINDQLDEWQYRDSADFSVPHPDDNPGQPANINQQIVVNGLVKNKINLSSNRMNGYLQSTFKLDTSITVTAGVRITYWDLNNDLNFSPRLSFAYQPLANKHLKFRAATGYYYQPPFYRELRNLSGEINKRLVAQKSIHFILASDYQFLAWGREFKLTSELFYKKMEDLIPYKLDNTRIRYLAKNNATGYATGIDFRLNGEFVSGIESWASLSFLKTEEDLNDDSYYERYNSEGELIVPGYTFNNVAVDSTLVLPGKIARPTDQRVTFSLFFQDYLPKFPSVRMHLNLVFGTGLPFGPPGNDRYKDLLRGPSYRRVDIGFSKIVIDEDKQNTSRLPLVSKLKSLWVSLEVFNLLQVSNTVSYSWITDVTGRQYGIPNYLTSRLLNLKLQAKF